MQENAANAAAAAPSPLSGSAPVPPGSLLALAAAMSSVWAVDALWAMQALPLLAATSQREHVAMYQRDGMVLSLRTGQHAAREHLARGGDASTPPPAPHDAADLYGVHRAPYGVNADGSRKPYPMDGGVALLAVTGPMTKEGPYSLEDGCSTVRARRLVRQCMSDADVTAALIRFDSPGGTVAGCDDLAADVARLAARKPTYGYCEDLCASAAYYVASQCNALYANGAALIGSIATVWTLYDLSRMFEEAGVEAIVTVPDDAPMKGSFTPGAPVTDAQRAYAKQVVTDMSRQFRGAVKRGRGMSDAELAAVIDGRCFMATEARRLKLIDGVTSYDNVLATLKKYKPAQ